MLCLDGRRRGPRAEPPRAADVQNAKLQGKCIESTVQILKGLAEQLQLQEEEKRV